MPMDWLVNQSMGDPRARSPGVSSSPIRSPHPKHRAESSSAAGAGARIDPAEDRHTKAEDSQGNPIARTLEDGSRFIVHVVRSIGTVLLLTFLGCERRGGPSREAAAARPTASCWYDAIVVRRFRRRATGHDPRSRYRHDPRCLTTLLDLDHRPAGTHGSPSPTDGAAAAATATPPPRSRPTAAPPITSSTACNGLRGGGGAGPVGRRLCRRADRGGPALPPLLRLRGRRAYVCTYVWACVT